MKRAMYYTKSAVKLLGKEKRFDDLIKLWELEKANNRVPVYKETLKELTYCQKEALKEQVKSGKRLAMDDDELARVKDFFCLA